VVFDHLLISVHPRGCYTARSFLERFLSDAKFSVDATSARSRLPGSPADLVLRMVNVMVDSYLDLRKELTQQLEHWQAELLKPNARFSNWNSLMSARSQLHVLEDLCDEQHDAMQEWLDSLREQPLSSFAADLRQAQAQQDQLVARARDVIEHIERVVHHARRLEQSAETVVQIHFSAQSNRTNDIMRTLTALTGPPRSAASRVAAPPRGLLFILGRPGAEKCPPRSAASRVAAPPRGLLFILGRPGAEKWPPRSAASRVAAPPRGLLFILGRPGGETGPHAPPLRGSLPPHATRPQCFRAGPSLFSLAAEGSITSPSDHPMRSGQHARLVGLVHAPQRGPRRPMAH
jgi:hypothetical protein